MFKKHINNDIISRQSTKRNSNNNNNYKKNIKTINFVFADVDILCFKLWFIVASVYIGTESRKKESTMIFI